MKIRTTSPWPWTLPKARSVASDVIRIRRSLGKDWDLDDAASVQENTRQTQPRGFEFLFPR